MLSTKRSGIMCSLGYFIRALSRSSIWPQTFVIVCMPFYDKFEFFRVSYRALWWFYIDDDRWNNKNLHICHNLPQTYGGSKYLRLISVRFSNNFPTYLKKSARIIERWSNMYDTHKSKITKEGSNQKLDGDFKSGKEINWSKQVWTPNPQPHQNFHKAASKENCYVGFVYSV